MAMFGLIVSGRLVQTEFQQISETQFLTTILDVDNINHIVLFLTGAVPFPEGLGGQVYFSWPDPTAPPNWQPLGFVSNQKPSAIFKISTLKKLHEMEGFTNVSTFGQQAICHNAQIGISIEQLNNMQDTQQTTNNNYVTFAQKMLQNFMNYTLSYSVSQSQMMANPSATYVPLSTVQNWYTNFERRLTQNPNFWKT
ncbi:PREDICTED: protein OPI10 homolog [Nicrophorus vespilloides]|uniref:Protein OPI10 homolog n=1 Tax=Nicrophorus vespilloides TaxID=110193 RepID=A0ABM1M6I2_NICVS|nr:PREDICTED: protein OPI10 homolog [Nicrophorus vespilloides]